MHVLRESKIVSQGFWDFRICKSGFEERYFVFSRCCVRIRSNNRLCVSFEIRNKYVIRAYTDVKELLYKNPIFLLGFHNNIASFALLAGYETY